MIKYILCLLLLCSTAFAADSLDEFGGWTGLQSTETHHVSGESSESVSSIILTDTGAFTGLDLSYGVLLPDVDEHIYFIIEANDDDNLYIVPSDRLEYDVITNGDMELDANWGDHNTPTTNERSSTSVVGDYSWHVVGDAANDGAQQTGLTIQNDRVGHNSGWGGEYRAIGLINVVSGTVNMSISDNNGSIYDAQVGTTDGGKWEAFETSNFNSTYEGAGTGTIEFYCSGGACEFYADEVAVGEYSYGYYNEYVGIDDYNSGTEEYRVYGWWRPEKIDNRWWLIDPLDNVFLYKGMNNLNSLNINSAGGVDFDGVRYCDNMVAKYPTESCTGAEMYRIQDIIDIGFNVFGSEVSSDSKYGRDLTWTEAETYGKAPYIAQVRIQDWDTNSDFDDVGEIDCPNTYYDDLWPDVYDVDYETTLEDEYTLGYNKTYLKTTQNITPYRYAPYTNLANLWYMGQDWGEEIRGTNENFINVACGFFEATDSMTTADDGVCDTKIGFVNFIRAKYTDGGEAAFIANIGEDASDELVHPSSWSGVTGYDATDTDADGTPDLDESAITNLNTAWGTTYPTENGDDTTNAWEYVIENSDDDTYGFNTRSDDCDLGVDAELDADMIDLHEVYSRKLHRELYENIMGPDSPFKNRKLNIGFGFQGHHLGWAKGIESKDGLTKYLNVVSVRGGCGTGSTLDHSVIVEADCSSMDDWQNTYDETGIPVILETSWVNANFDYYGSILNGTVDAVYQPGDGAVRGSYDAQNTPDCVIAQDASVSWDAGGNTGTMIQMWDATVNTNAQNRYILIEDSAGTLLDNDEVTDGSCTITVAGAPTDTSLLYDADANFDTGYDNPSSLFHNGHWCIIYNKESVFPETMYMIRADDWVAEHALISYKAFGQDVSGSYNDNSFEDLSVGDEYVVGSQDLNRSFNGFTDEIYLLDSQTKRADRFIDRTDLWFNKSNGAGENFVIGFAHWSYNDYGWADYKAQELESFGFFTVEDNAYDGVEATTLGADGIAGTDDDEEVDYGDYITPITTYLTNIYSDLISEDTSTSIGGCSISGASFN